MAVTHNHELGRYEKHFAGSYLDELVLAETRLAYLEFQKWFQKLYSDHVAIRPI